MMITHPSTIFAAILGPVALLVACASSSSSSSPSPVHATDYDQKCDKASDCVVVGEGDVCGCNSCPTAAINKSDQARYQSDWNTRKSLCSGPPPMCPGVMCAFAAPICIAGACAICRSAGCNDAGVDSSTD